VELPGSAVSLPTTRLVLVVVNLRFLPCVKYSLSLRLASLVSLTALDFRLIATQAAGSSK